MQPAPLGFQNFLSRYFGITSELMADEEVYEISLKKSYRDLVSLYMRFVSDMTSGRPDVMSKYLYELNTIEFSLYNTIYEDIAKSSTRLIKDLNSIHFFYADASELNIAIRENNIQKVNADRCFNVEGKHEMGINMMKNAVNNLFKTYSDFKAKKQNLERTALKKWGGVFLGIYGTGMIVYFAILTFMQVKPDFWLGIGVPVFVAFFLLLLLWAILQPNE